MCGDTKAWLTGKWQVLFSFFFNESQMTAEPRNVGDSLWVTNFSSKQIVVWFSFFLQIMTGILLLLAGRYKVVCLLLCDWDLAICHLPLCKGLGYYYVEL